MEIKIERSEIRRLNRVLEKLPIELQIAAYDQAMRPAANVVKRRAAQLAPRSADTGTRNKMSAKSREIWSPITIGNLLAVKLLKSKKRNGDPYALVGPKYPEGNKANFVHPMITKTRRIKLWGRDPAGGATSAPRDNDFLKRAFDETRTQQIRVFTRAVIKYIRKVGQK